VKGGVSTMAELLLIDKSVSLFELSSGNLLQSYIKTAVKVNAK
jgi:hypothetical protein